VLYVGASACNSWQIRETVINAKKRTHYNTMRVRVQDSVEE